MRGTALAVACGLILVAGRVHAQDCRQPVPDSLSYTSRDSVRTTVSTVRTTIESLLRDRKYKLLPDSDSLLIQTRPLYEWPDDPVAAPLRARQHPGVSITVQLEPHGDFTTVVITSRAACLITTQVPAGGLPPVERAAAAAATVDLDLGIGQRLERFLSLPEGQSPSQPPAVVHCPAPAYPDFIRHLGIVGSVVLSFTVDSSGVPDPSSISVTQSLNPALDAAAVDAAKRCRFHPARVGERPVRAAVRMPFSFVP